MVQDFVLFCFIFLFFCLFSSHFVRFYFVGVSVAFRFSKCKCRDIDAKFIVAIWTCIASLRFLIHGHWISFTFVCFFFCCALADAYTHKFFPHLFLFGLFDPALVFITLTWTTPFVPLSSPQKKYFPIHFECSIQVKKISFLYFLWVLRCVHAYEIAIEFILWLPIISITVPLALIN